MFTIARGFQTSEKIITYYCTDIPESSWNGFNKPRFHIDYKGSSQTLLVSTMYINKGQFKVVRH